MSLVFWISYLSGVPFVDKINFKHNFPDWLTFQKTIFAFHDNCFWNFRFFFFFLWSKERPRKWKLKEEKNVKELYTHCFYMRFSFLQLFLFHVLFVSLDKTFESSFCLLNPFNSLQQKLLKVVQKVRKFSSYWAIFCHLYGSVATAATIAAN